MIGSLGPRRIIAIVALAAAWCALWGDLSFANIAGGLLVSSALTVPAVTTPLRGSIDPVAMSRLVALVVTDLAKSTVAVAREILTPTDYTDEVVVEVTLEPELRCHMLLLVVAVTLTPGTAVIDADIDTGVLTLHLLHADQTDSTIAHVERLARIAEQAMPSTGRDVSREAAA